MIHSLFVINQTGDIFLEKHWKSVLPRSVCDPLLDAQRKAPNPADVPPVIAVSGGQQQQFLFSILRHNLFFVAVGTRDVPPLFVFEFLHRVVDILEDYFSEPQLTESVIKEHYVLIYELLDEMLDNGFPLATEANILKELIKPPNILRMITNTVTGRSNVSATLPTGQLTNVPWRRAGVKYTNNEAYFDVVEELDAIIDKSGSVVSAEIQGYIDCCIKLSGMPDLSMTFVNPRLFDDVSLHPCVRLRRWETERALSFVPPDGNSRLMSYHIGAQNIVSIPLAVRHSISFKESSGGRVEIQLGPRTSMGKPIDAVIVEITFPKAVLNVTATSTQGRVTFDPVTRLMQWHVGRLEATKGMPHIRGTITMQSGAPLPDCNPNILIRFTINQMAISGLKVNRLDMFNEKYKPFKGVKYLTRAGNFQVRT